jgi:energy-coupling factor transporter ATP-binding protein EcfA2
MSSDKGFNRKLLELSNEEKLRYFKQYKAGHDKLKEVSGQVKSAIRYLDDGCFILLVGPSGIGKTTAMNGIYNSLILDYMPAMQADAGLIPVIKVNTKAEDGRFDWKEHWRDCLRELQEPLIDYKILPRRTRFDKSDNIIDPDEGSGTKPVLRNAFESAARNRKLVVCFHDEAHHFTYVSSARLIRQQHEILKSAASRSKSIFALFGTYDLLKLRNLSGQLGRRTVTIHFQRYGTNDNDIKAFVDALKSLLAHMPLQRRPEFSDRDMETCFYMSLGCIGLLKDIFVASLDSVLEAGAESLSIKDVIEHELPTDVLDRISWEIVNGEKKLEESAAQQQLRRETIKMRMEKGAKYLVEHPEEAQFSDEQDKQSAPSTSASAQTPAQTKRGGKKRRRVERSPRRDPVGEGRKNVA